MFDRISNPALGVNDQIVCEKRELSRSQREALDEIEGFERAPAMQPTFVFKEEWEGGRPTIPFALISAVNTNKLIDPKNHDAREPLGITPTVIAVRNMEAMFERMKAGFPDVMVETAPDFYGVVDHKSVMIAAPNNDYLEAFMMSADLT